MEPMILMKGFLIGASMLIPGVSGGTMAMIFGIYDRLISSISSFMKHKKESALFLLQFVIGAGAAFLILAGPMAALSRNFPREMAFFVIGAIVGGIPVIYKETKVKKLSVYSLIYLAIGLLLVVLSGMMPRNLFSAGDSSLMGFVFQFIAGILGALALVLPGISFSSMLYMMGVYETIFGAIGNRDVMGVLPFALGCILGILLLTRFLEIAMKKYPHPTYMIILGFVIGSIGDIIAEMPGLAGIWNTLFCIVLAAVGFICIRLLSRYEE